MENQVLTVAQMQELQELGIDTSKASMCWMHMVDDDINKPWYQLTLTEGTEGPRDVLTFTLQDILEMLPQRIEINGIHYKFYLDSIGDLSIANTNFGRQFKILDAFLTDKRDMLGTAFHALKWCKQNNYI